MGITYKASGVDIEAGDETVNRIKPMVKSTFRKEVLAGIGLFGGFFDASFPGYEHPVLVSSVDGVGTKLKVAFITGRHDTVGQDLVNHCVNDILCSGAEPLYFMDYFATGKLSPDNAEQLIGGFVKACKENGCALIGGETAEMPDFYGEGEYDISGTIVGVVEKKKIIDGKSIKPGDVLIGLPSTGLRTNGYSLARKALFDKYKADEHVDELGKTVGEALLEVHRSYFHAVKPLLDKDLLNGISHITGGGIIGNTIRILPEGTAAEIDWNSWKPLPIFDLIQKTGNIDDEEMRHVFNLGIGIILIADKGNADEIMNMISDEKPVIIGKVVSD